MKHGGRGTMCVVRDEQKRIAKYESNLKEEETRLLEDIFIKQKPWILYVFAVASALILEVCIEHRYAVQVYFCVVDPNLDLKGAE